ncbi:hypothetical protein SISNIDRAFT_488052 [Sistotremastrum niveocremeum HHB9708]|uniref:Uncharacterized protein n=1 Tax=Sistotremastrum niveocremeum HHB9708 TaxID=1314777 RepID=A0A164RPL6_9AGAM|nr:hypothetical protein SISNIDRAFT_488052 [Sistotremastrum niveocremeum HHB9708]
MSENTDWSAILKSCRNPHCSSKDPHIPGSCCSFFESQDGTIDIKNVTKARLFASKCLWCDCSAQSHCHRPDQNNGPPVAPGGQVIAHHAPPAPQALPGEAPPPYAHHAPMQLAPIAPVHHPPQAPPPVPPVISRPAANAQHAVPQVNPLQTVIAQRETALANAIQAIPGQVGYRNMGEYARARDEPTGRKRKKKNQGAKGKNKAPPPKRQKTSPPPAPEKNEGPKLYSVVLIPDGRLVAQSQHKLLIPMGTSAVKTKAIRKHHVDARGKHPDRPLEPYGRNLLGFPVPAQDRFYDYVDQKYWGKFEALPSDSAAAVDQKIRTALSHIPQFPHEEPDCYRFLKVKSGGHGRTGALIYFTRGKNAGDLGDSVTASTLKRLASNHRNIPDAMRPNGRKVIFVALKITHRPLPTDDTDEFELMEAPGPVGEKRQKKAAKAKETFVVSDEDMESESGGSSDESSAASSGEEESGEESDKESDKEGGKESREEKGKEREVHVKVEEEDDPLNVLVPHARPYKREGGPQADEEEDEGVWEVYNPTLWEPGEASSSRRQLPFDGGQLAAAKSESHVPIQASSSANSYAAGSESAPGAVAIQSVVPPVVNNKGGEKHKNTGEGSQATAQKPSGKKKIVQAVSDVKPEGRSAHDIAADCAMQAEMLLTILENIHKPSQATSWYPDSACAPYSETSCREEYWKLDSALTKVGMGRENDVTAAEGLLDASERYIKAFPIQALPRLMDGPGTRRFLVNNVKFGHYGLSPHATLLRTLLNVLSRGWILEKLDAQVSMSILSIGDLLSRVIAAVRYFKSCGSEGSARVPARMFLDREPFGQLQRHLVRSVGHLSVGGEAYIIPALHLPKPNAKIAISAEMFDDAMLKDFGHPSEEGYIDVERMHLGSVRKEGDHRGGMGDVMGVFQLFLDEVPRVIEDYDSYLEVFTRWAKIFIKSIQYDREIKGMRALKDPQLAYDSEESEGEDIGAVAPTAGPKKRPRPKMKGKAVTKTSTRELAEAQAPNTTGAPSDGARSVAVEPAANEAGLKELKWQPNIPATVDAETRAKLLEIAGVEDAKDLIRRLAEHWQHPMRKIPRRVLTAVDRRKGLKELREAYEDKPEDSYSDPAWGRVAPVLMAIIDRRLSAPGTP